MVGGRSSINNNSGLTFINVWAGETVSSTVYYILHKFGYPLKITGGINKTREYII
jgi:hypothetical protein